ncbi:hypothetical protein C9374_014080 [Naegleria lovaniensis]|uniref:UDENN domain-containing protein n=1 Tax=Naegleria lovaniensis TaxID=51637 RepID=A0AA88GYR4_NAELO|nr:uncharacterized protein C9374_014080 [Naegleria lovaniensis]KAG2389520.1 hypothetical protein C9374_014080 [Naegleria lovaniensis]
MTTRLVDYLAVIGTNLDPRDYLITNTTTPMREQHEKLRDGLQKTNALADDEEFVNVEHENHAIHDSEDVTTSTNEFNSNQILFSDKVKKPVILDRYPKEDFPNYPLSNEIPLFCFPSGEISISVDECTLPSFFTFVLTGSDGNKTYGACLNVWEEYNLDDVMLPSRKSSEAQIDEDLISLVFDPIKTERKSSTIYMSKSICIISHYPFYNVFKFFLTQMYRISITPSKIPIERFISNFVSEVPLPSQGKVQVHYSIGDKEIYITRPPPNDLPLAELDFELIFSVLSLDNILILFDLVLQERKILFISEHAGILTPVAEIICQLMFPFKWHHIYIPLLPSKCAEFLFAPVPFIMGIQRQSITNEIPADVFQIDLDNNLIVCNKQQSVPNLPEKQKAKLKKTLSDIVKCRVDSARSVEKRHFYDLAYSMAPLPDDIDPVTGENYVFPTKEVRLAFFKFFVNLFGRYRTYYKDVDDTDKEYLINLDLEAHFRKKSFIASLPDQAQSFMTIFLQTQSFERFLLDRLEKANQHEVLLFDEYIIEKNNKDAFRFKKTPLHFINKNYSISKTLMSLSPDLSNLPATTEPYIYTRFPTSFDHSLFTKREYSQLLVSESEIKSDNEINLSWKACITTLSSLSGHGMSSSSSTDTSPRYVPFTSSSINSSSKLGISNMLLDELSNNNYFNRFSFNTHSECYHCHHMCNENEIRIGWNLKSAQTYTTQCPMCKKPFVPRFEVYFTLDSSSTEEPQQTSIRLITSVEYLSPLVLRKEIDNLVSHDVKADSALVWQHPVLFWNLIVHFRSSPLPLSFIFPCIDWNEVITHVVTTLTQKSSAIVH